MIKMQLEEHIFNINSRLMHIFIQNGELEIEITNSILRGFTSTIVLNIVSRRILSFALYYLFNCLYLISAMFVLNC